MGERDEPELDIEIVATSVELPLYTEIPSDPDDQAPRWSDRVGELRELARWTHDVYAALAETTPDDLPSRPFVALATDKRPKRGSRAVRLVWQPLDDVRSGLARLPRRGRLRFDARKLTWSEDESAWVVNGTLRVPFSFPRLRIRLQMQQWTANRTLLEVVLRSRFRLRHPRRFYRVGGAVLEDLGARLPA